MPEFFFYICYFSVCLSVCLFVIFNIWFSQLSYKFPNPLTFIEFSKGIPGSTEYGIIIKDIPASAFHSILYKA